MQEEISIQTLVPATLRHSAEFKNLFAALIKAQSQFVPVPKNKTASVRTKAGATYTYKYADLADVLAMALPILTMQSLGLLQPHLTVNGRLRVCTLLIHATGEWLMSDGIDIPEFGPRQDFGSDSTYNRRYDLCTLLGIVADEDIDAQKDQPAGTQPVRQPSPRQTTPAEALVDERDGLVGKLKSLVPGAELNRRAAVMFPEHRTSKTLTVADLRRLHEAILKERADEEKRKAIQEDTGRTPADLPPDVAAMFEEGTLTTAGKLTGPKLGKALAQKLHILIGLHKVHTEKELEDDYLKPLGIEHASDLPKDLYPALCDWATGKLQEGGADGSGE